MVQAIIFDCFGVLVTEGWLPFADKHIKHDHLLQQKAAELMTALNKGRVNYSDFIKEISEMTGINEATAYRQIMRNAPNMRLLDYIRTTLKPTYKIGLLSNTGRDRLDELLSADDLRLFDALSLSFETGYLKPQPEAYKAAATSLHVSVQDCVFIDDQAKRCQGALAVGMQAIVYQNFEQMKRDLESVLTKSE